MPAEYRAIWSVPRGGTGYSVFHFVDAVDSSDAQGQANAVRAFFDGIKNVIPNDVTFTFDPEVKVLNSAGVLIDVIPVTVPTGVVGANESEWAGASGFRVDWATGVIAGGRRLAGRTYIVPSAANVFDASGNITSSAISYVQTAAAALITAASTHGVLGVWSRKNGTTAPVTSGRVAPKGAVLRSRRD